MGLQVLVNFQLQPSRFLKNCLRLQTYRTCDLRFLESTLHYQGVYLSLVL